MTSKIFRNMGFGEIIEWAEELGWKDPNLLTNGEWTGDDCDATELAAMEYIVSHGFKKAKMTTTIVCVHAHRHGVDVFLAANESQMEQLKAENYQDDNDEHWDWDWYLVPK